MTLAGCPFHVECPFYNLPVKTAAEEVLVLGICRGRYDACTILDKYLAGGFVPLGARPDGGVHA